MRPAFSDQATLPSMRTSSVALAEEVVAGLQGASGELRQLVRLRLEATDAAVAFDAPELLAEQRRWEEVRLAVMDEGISATRLDRQVAKVINQQVDLRARRAVAVVHSRSARCVLPARLPPAPAGSAAHTYLTTALEGRREDALALVQDALDRGASAAEVMLGMLSPAQVELGERWERGTVSVAHEHYVTAVTELALGLMYEQLSPRRIDRGQRVVTATSGAETHELAIRMVSDLLYQDGWQSVHLGCDLPTPDLVELVAQRAAAVVVVSVSMPGHLRWLGEVVARVRADQRLAGVRVLVGGHPFDLVPALADRFGADAYASDAAEAVQVCRRWATEAVRRRDLPTK